MWNTTSPMVSIDNLVLIVTYQYWIECIDGLPSPIVLFILCQGRWKSDQSHINEPNTVLKEWLSSNVSLGLNTFSGIGPPHYSFSSWRMAYRHCFVYLSKLPDAGIKKSVTDLVILERSKVSVSAIKQSLASIGIPPPPFPDETRLARATDSYHLIGAWGTFNLLWKSSQGPILCRSVLNASLGIRAYIETTIARATS